MSFKTAAYPSTLLLTVQKIWQGGLVIRCSRTLATSDDALAGSSFLRAVNQIQSSLCERCDRARMVLLVPTDGNRRFVQESRYVNHFADQVHPVKSRSISRLLSGDTFDPIASGRMTRAEFHAKNGGHLSLPRKSTMRLQEG